MPPIEGLVAEVLDQYRIVANIGETDGVEIGMEFLIFEEEGGYTDPETGEDLGTRTIEKASVDVIEVYEKMSVMESAESVYSNPITSSLITGSKSRKKLPTDENVETSERTVKRGDMIVQQDNGEDDE